MLFKVDFYYLTLAVVLCQNCSVARSLIRIGESVDVTSFSSSAELYRDDRRLVWSNVELESRIVNGDPVNIERFPSSAMLFNRGSLCSSSIVNSWCVVTAAHCFDHNRDVGYIAIHAGSRYLYDPNADIHNVAKVVVHPDYNKKLAFACDIALVYLVQHMELGKKMKKAVLVDTDRWMSANETRFQVTGWGWTHYGGPLSEMGLMLVNLQFVSLSKCSQMHARNFTPDMFCLYGDAVRDACKGDSGGGVLWNGMLVGIVSHGDGCAKKDKPSVYVNVWYFRKWIEDQIINYFSTNCLVITD